MEKHDLRARGAVWVAATFLLGCSGGKLASRAPDGGDGAAPLSTFAGNWDGYAEATAFTPDGTDRVRLVVGAMLTGTLEIGNQATLPPATDPNVGYPPDSDPADSSGLWEGFLYPIHASSTAESRLQLGLDPSDIYAAWCALETPVLWWQYQSTPDGGLQNLYSCVPNWGTGPSGLPDAGAGAGPGCALFPPDGGAGVPIDCDKLFLCDEQRVCACTATTCTARGVAANTPINQFPIDLDVTLDDTGTMLNGTLAMPNGTRLNVHFTKQ
jgi:hypothetical protein